MTSGSSQDWYVSGCEWLAREIYPEALACFEMAAALAPEDGAIHHNAGTAAFNLGLIDEAISRFRTSLSLAVKASFLPRTAIATLIPGSPAADHLAVLTARRDWFETHLPPTPARSPRGRGGSARLRVGYLSSFFQSRNWMKPVWGLINEHDRQSIDVHLFADCAAARCEGYTPDERDTFHDISALSNRGAAARIEQAAIDILVDLNGFSSVTRLAVVAQRPAPIQVAWFNLYATSGMTCFDYLIGDDQVVGRDEEPFYTETIVRVPGSYLTFRVTYPVPDVADLPALTAGYVTFGCLASQYKITPAVVETWARILRRSPRARLLLKNAALAHDANREHLAGRFSSHGVTIDRLIFEGPADHRDFLAAYSRVDVALDTFPYNGGTTTTEALWQGVPMLTFRGDRWASRMSASILVAAGLDEWVSRDVDEYVERAVALANDPRTPERLGIERREMRQRLLTSRVCDTFGFARAMEAIYRRLCQVEER
jgi:predicted O-linked N-acetylglucosamine transferase (SPINDLY family)